MKTTFPMRIVFPGGRLEAQTLFQNDVSNNCRMQVRILLDETGRCLYQSHWLKPGETLNRVVLAKALPIGSHEATALINMEAAPGETETGSIIVDVKLLVEA